MENLTLLLVWLHNIYLRPGLQVNMNRSKFVKELWESEFVRVSSRGIFNTQATPFEITPLGKKFLAKHIHELTPEEEQPDMVLVESHVENNVVTIFGQDHE